MTGTTALHDNHTPFTLTSMTLSHSSGEISPKGTLAMGIVEKTAAFVTNMSIDPKASILVPTIRCRLPSSDTSVVTPMAVNPSCSNSSARPSAASPSTSAITTLAPSRARPLQYSLPIPCPPPVTTAVFPSNRSPDRDIAHSFLDLPISLDTPPSVHSCSRYWEHFLLRQLLLV